MISWRHLLTEQVQIDCESIWSGVNSTPAHLPFYLFYDERGSELFRQITMTPEYYLTRTEKNIFVKHGAAIAQACGEQRVWFEPGAGCCDKALMLLQHANAAAYVAMDISESALQTAVQNVNRQMPQLPIQLVVADFNQGLDVIAAQMPSGARTVFYPGSSIGNFTPEQAQQWLSQLAQVAGQNGQLVLGFDCPKANEVIDAAYNDRDRLTEKFNLNVLHHLQRLRFELDVNAFEHWAFYNRAEHRVEMHLRCRYASHLRWQGQAREFVAGETVLTEYSYKYPPEMLIAIAERAGWTLRQRWCDEQEWFCVMLFENT